ncbi:YitT family protein [Psychroserpens sp. Hel_I_66]|uniref:YitT family protein n=1 Tax=Psychroserpens sp. Hel_I_66 TaxID=1250004 RepID=UPI000645495D|nr:YitT family protein [Psychroserpens sp. Hel_I_66]
MNPFISKILVNIAQKRLEANKSSKPITKSEINPLVKKLEVELAHTIKEYAFIVIGVFAAGFGLKGFLLPNQFIDGGATGISLLVQNITKLPLGILLILVNLPFLLLATKTINKTFALRSIIAIAFLALVVHYVDYPVVTEDKLLIAIFGGFFLGLGIGMAIRGGSVIDGTEILAIYLSRKLSISIGDVLLLINVIIFSFGAYILSVEIALYAILTYLSAAKTVDFVVDGVEEYIGVTIISDFHDDIRKVLTEKLERACTIYPARGGYKNDNTHYDKSVIYIIITRLELAKLNTEIDKIDKQAFIIMNVVKDLRGGTIKRKPLK